MSKKYTYQKVAEHRSRDDIYVVLKSKVYDVTRFINMHPGGEDVILRLAGQDVTEEFDGVGHSEDAHKQLVELLIGVLDEESITASRSTKTGDASTMLHSYNRGYLRLLTIAASVAVGYGMWHVSKQ